MLVKNKNIPSLINKVIDKIGNPVSKMVVLATLESFGIRNIDVHHDYGLPTLSALADYIYSDLKSRDQDSLLNINERNPRKVAVSIPVSEYQWVKAGLFAKYYPLGIFHLMPVFIQVATIIIYGYSLWAYMGFNTIQSTAVVLGVILGIVLSGGYVQIMGRQASFYWNHKEYYKAKVVSDRLMMYGIKGMLFTFLIMFLINGLTKPYPHAFVLITVIYAFLIGTLLLAIAPFYAIGQRWVISVVIAICSVFALFLHLKTEMHVYFSQWMGILLSIMLSKIYLRLFFKSKIKKITENKVEPDKMMVIYKNYPYFFYGIFIYAFIFMDRIVAWSANMELSSEFPFLYEKSYEIGMDLAIIIFFMLAGVMEYAIASFTKFMDIKQKTVLLSKKNVFGKKMFKIYRHHIGLLLITAITAGIFLFFFVSRPWGYLASFGETIDVTSTRVCIMGSVGYFFLSWGMLNALYLFTLNRPKEVLKALIISSFINFIIGFFMSRWIAFEYSVVGMLIGSFLFMILTTRYIKQYFNHLDFHYYASY